MIPSPFPPPINMPTYNNTELQQKKINEQAKSTAKLYLVENQIYSDTRWSMGLLFKMLLLIKTESQFSIRFVVD